MPDITVIGSINMDMVIHTSRIPELGETILGGGFMTAPGGKGANQAVAAARLGGDVAMIGCVGDDLFGKDLLSNLKINGVNTDNVHMQQDVPTGVAVITVKDGDNSIIVDPGANALVTREAVDRCAEMIARSRVLVMQLEIPLDTVRYAADIARRHGVKILLNPAPARELDDAFISVLDIMTPNESECAILTGMRIRTIENAKDAVHLLKGKGVSRAVITLGEKGVVYNLGEMAVHKAARRVKPVDTTAAGDAFTGALAVATAAGRPIDEAIDFAGIAGMLTVQRRGAQNSLPGIQEIKQYCESLRFTIGQP